MSKHTWPKEDGEVPDLMAQRRGILIRPTLQPKHRKETTHYAT